MKVKNLKTRIAAFGLAVLMGVSTLSSANAFAAEQTDVGQEVQASEQAATSQKEKAVTADDITKEISDETFAVETSMEGIHYDAEKEDVTLVSIQDEKGGEYHPDKAGTYIASYMVVPKDQSDSYIVMLIAILGAFFGKWKYVIKAVCFYAVICALTVWIMAEMTGTLRTMFIAFLGLFHKVYACGILAGIVLTTTKVNEFLSAMNRVHAPKKLVIPMAVMLRYIPTIQEDWRYIKDAMRMRDVSPSLAGFLSHPGMTVECIYVPLLMAASKAADDLSVASVTRGIENPNPRTCLVQIKCGAADWGVMAVAVAYLIFELCVRGGVIS